MISNNRNMTASINPSPDILCCLGFAIGDIEMAQENPLAIQFDD